MKIHAIICTRDRKLNAVTNGLVRKFMEFSIPVKILPHQESIFSAYRKGLDHCEAEDEDIVIMCHDDIQILDNQETFEKALSVCLEDKTGIVGPAGTTHLNHQAVWWDWENQAQGLHRGSVKHVHNKNAETNRKQGESHIISTVYGPPGRVVVLDGLFLAAQKKVWEKVGLEKPEYFPGKWDFYDLHYTSQAHLLGYENFAIPLDIIHHSGGELAGRTSWHKNREAFIAHTALPLSV